MSVIAWDWTLVWSRLPVSSKSPDWAFTNTVAPEEEEFGCGNW